MNLSRRGFLGFLAAAPIIVRPGILMPVKPLPMTVRVSSFTGITFTQDGLKITIDEFSRLYFGPAMKRLHQEIAADIARDYWKPTASSDWLLA